MPTFATAKPKNTPIFDGIFRLGNVLKKYLVVTKYSYIFVVLSPPLSWVHSEVVIDTEEVGAFSQVPMRASAAKYF